MSNFGKKYSKDPVKTFNRKQVSALHPRKPRKKSTTKQSYSTKKYKPVKISGKEFLIWLVFLFIVGLFH